MKFTFDATKSPKRITMPGKTAPDAKADRTIAGIYELKGDTLRVCFAEEGKALPTEFKVGKGEDGGLIELERIPEGLRDLKDLAGEWKVLSVERDGKPAKGAEMAGPVEIYRDVAWMTDGDRTEKMIVGLDAAKGFLDLTPITGPEAVRGKPMLGRFTWKDGKLTIHSGAPGAERPAEAKGVSVIVMERAMKK